MPEHPFAAERCVLCGEYLGREEDIGEMAGSPKWRHGIESLGTVEGGLVHAQCGRDVGWEVA